MTAREPREITLAEIERTFELASYWFSGAWCPAVFAAKHGWSIRVVKSHSFSSASQSVTYDYFELALDGTITTAPRGYAKDFRPGRVVDIEAAAERFAQPLPGARRFGL
jgi:hypothetical protein